MQAHIDKINEMASVMKKAIEVDEGRLCEDEERIKQLEVKANAHFLLSTLHRVIFLLFWTYFIFWDVFLHKLIKNSDHQSHPEPLFFSVVSKYCVYRCVLA